MNYVWCFAGDTQLQFKTFTSCFTDKRICSDQYVACLTPSWDVLHLPAWQQKLPETVFMSGDMVACTSRLHRFLRQRKAMMERDGVAFGTRSDLCTTLGMNGDFPPSNLLELSTNQLWIQSFTSYCPYYNKPCIPPPSTMASGWKFIVATSSTSLSITFVQAPEHFRTKVSMVCCLSILLVGLYLCAWMQRTWSRRFVVPPWCRRFFHFSA